MKELKKLPAELRSLAKKGVRKKVVYAPHEDFTGYKTIMERFARRAGLTLKSDHFWVEAERGDPESGEGACDAHGVNMFILTW